MNFNTIEAIALSLQSAKTFVGEQCQSHVKCIWQIMLSRVTRAHKNITQSSHFCAKGTANFFILVRSTDCILE